jgi:hypothetical protein
MAVVECETEMNVPTMNDYANDIEALISEESDRIRRILKVIDESMAAIQKSRKILSKTK